MKQQHLRTLTDKETKFLDKYVLLEVEKNRIKRIWEKSIDTVVDHMLPFPKGTRLGVDILYVSLLLWFIASPGNILKIVIGIIGWLMIILNFFVPRITRRLYAKKIYLTLSPTSLSFYYESMFQKILYHILKAATIILLWRCDRIDLAIFFVLATTVSTYQQSKLKVIIEEDLHGKRDMIIEAMDNYSLKNFSKIAQDG